MRKALHSRQLTNYVGAILNNWASDVLGVPKYPLQTGHSRIDLLDDSIGVEVKSRSRKYHNRWAIHNHQYEHFPIQHPDQDLYYAFILYSMNQTAGQIRTKDIRQISPLMQDREMWVLPWSWIEQFPISEKRTGKYRYPQKSDFPDVRFFSEYVFEQSPVFVPQESSIESHLEKYSKDVA